MSADDLTPAGESAVRLALTVASLRRDLESAEAELERLHDLVARLHAALAGNQPDTPGDGT